MAGKTKPEEYQWLAIKAYAESQPAGSPIHEIVASPTVQTTRKAYETADARAVKSQDVYKRGGTIALWATTLGTIIGALLLMPLRDWLPAGVVKTISALQTVGIIVFFLVVRWMIFKKPGEAWMQARAEAEQARGELFRAIVNAPLPAGASAGVAASQKLACLKAAHVDDQIAYFATTAAKHRVKLARGRPIQITGYVLIGIAVVLGIGAAVQFVEMIGFAVWPWLTSLADGLVALDSSRWQLGLSTIASSLLAYVATRAHMHQYERNAELYEKTALGLKAIVDRDHGEVERRAASGDEGAVRQFLDAVRHEMDAEHRVWLLAAPITPADMPMKHTTEA